MQMMTHGSSCPRALRPACPSCRIGLLASSIWSRAINALTLRLYSDADPFVWDTLINFSKAGDAEIQEACRLVAVVRAAEDVAGEMANNKASDE